MTIEQKRIKQEEKLLLTDTNLKIYNSLLPKMIEIQNSFLRKVGIKLDFGKTTAEEVEVLFSSYSGDYKEFDFNTLRVKELFQKAVKNQIRI